MADMDEKVYRPAWRGFYKNIILMCLTFIGAVWLSCIQISAGSKNIVWGAAIIVIALALLDMMSSRKEAKKAGNLDEHSAMRNYLVMGVSFVLALLLSFVPLEATVNKSVLWIVSLVVILALFADIWVARMSVKLTVKKEEVAYDRGILHPKSTEIGYQNLTVDVDRSLWQYFLNVGTLSIASSGTSGYEIVAHNMPDPRAIRDEIQAHDRARAKGNFAAATAAAPETPAATPESK